MRQLRVEPEDPALDCGGPMSSPSETLTAAWSRLSESTRRLVDQLVAANRDPVVVIDAAQRVWRGNRAYQTLLSPRGARVDGDDLLQQLQLAFDGPGDEARLRAALRPSAEDAAGASALALDATLGPVGPRRLHARVEPLALGPDGAEPLWLVVLRDRVAPAPIDQDETQRLRTAVALGNIGIWEFDLATRRYRLDAVAARLLGFGPDPEGIDAEAMLASVHPEDRLNVRAADRVVLERDVPTDVTCRHRRGSHDWRELLTRRVLQRDAQGVATGFIGIVLDVEQQARSNRRLLELARRLDVTARAAGLGVWSHAAGQRRPEWNDQMRVLLGLPVDEPPPPVREWAPRCVHRDDLPAFLAALSPWLRDGTGSLDLEFRVVWPDGTVRWLASRARYEPMREGPLRVGVVFDITDQRAAQSALRDAYERAALSARGAGIATWERSAGDEAAIWDDQMYRLRGFDPDEGPRDDAARRALVHPDDALRIIEQQTRTAHDGRLVSYEFRVRLPDGSYRWLASRAKAVCDESGRVSRMIGVNWDLTDVRTAETERRDKEIARRESQAKSQFLARISHELRTPLNAVLGFTQLLQSQEDGSSPSRAARLGHIHNGGEHLLTLIDEMLDISRLESGQLALDLRPVPMDDVLREALPLVQQLARERGVTIEVGPVAGWVLADWVRLRQVLINLLSNAIKYNRPQGRVAVRGTSEGGWLSLHVSDTGRGMSRQQLRHLFEPFNRLGIEREGIEGTGIGLVIVRMLVERMSGRVEVRSEPGVGSVFELRLRMPEGEAEAAPSLRAETPGVSLPTVRAGEGSLLYIEDNLVNTVLVQELVAQRPSLRLSCASDGAGGIDDARRLRPDLILVDMQLPDMDGHEVLRRLRAAPETADIPCIALSANAMSEDIDLALAAGFSGYWTKPIDLRGFLASLDALFQPPGAPG